MLISLISRDEVMAKSCREVLDDLYGPDSVLTVLAPGETIPQEGVCIWDFDPHETVCAQAIDTVALRLCLFLADRKHLAALRALVGTSDVHVTLKPVTRATLRVLLGGAAGRVLHQNNAPEDRANALRHERDEMLQFLIQANLKLQEYDQQRNNFLARSVHDFRAPLTAISGYCALLLEGELGPITSEQNRVLGRMQHSANRLSRLSDAMFKLTIPHDKEQKPKIEKADIRDSIEQALHELSLVLEEKRIAVTVDVETPPENLLFERSQIEQTLLNLLDNASKFTPRDGSIEIKGYSYFWERRTRACPIDPSSDRRIARERTPNSFRLDIHDSGPGILPIHLERIFEEYTAYSGGQDRSGAGLGLAICRMILHQHGGRVWAESNPAGTVFSFVLPLHPHGQALAEKKLAHSY